MNVYELAYSLEKSSYEPTVLAGSWLGAYEIIGINGKNSSLDEYDNQGELFNSSLLIGYFDYRGNEAFRLFDTYAYSKDGTWKTFGNFPDIDKVAIPDSSPIGQLSCVDTPVQHLAAVEYCIQHIRQGDIFQANICTRFKSKLATDAIHAFSKIGAKLNAKKSAYIPGQKTIASFSPESFIESLDGQNFASRPIKGTKPRTGKNDDQTRKALESSLKDKSENTIIVDLIRNDMAMSCKVGSIDVPRLNEIIEAPGVWHLQSEVVGKKKINASTVELIRAALAPGSVTGAPKARAQEIIQDLEANNRDVYTGSIGVVGPNGICDFNVVIRTLEIEGSTVEIGSGGGITTASSPIDELAEVYEKVAPIADAAGVKLEKPKLLERYSEHLEGHQAHAVFTTGLLNQNGLAEAARHRDRLFNWDNHLNQGQNTEAISKAMSNLKPSSKSLRVRISLEHGKTRIETEDFTPSNKPSQKKAELVELEAPFGPLKLKDRTSIDKASKNSKAENRLPIFTVGDEILESEYTAIALIGKNEVILLPIDGQVLDSIGRAQLHDVAVENEFKVTIRNIFISDLNSNYVVCAVNALRGLIVLDIEGKPINQKLLEKVELLHKKMIERSTVHASTLEPSSSKTIQNAEKVKIQPRIGKKIALIDNNDSFVHTLAHYIEAQGPEVEIFNEKSTLQDVIDSNPDGIVLSPGPGHPKDAVLSRQIVSSKVLSVPILGICLGHQVIGLEFGAKIVRASEPVHGRASEIINNGSNLFDGNLLAGRYHSLAVTDISKELTPTASTQKGTNMAIEHKSLPIYGLQFHPESILSQSGQELVQKFTKQI